MNPNVNDLAIRYGVLNHHDSRPCDWCFQRAAGSLPPWQMHRPLYPVVKNGVISANTEGDPITSDGRNHPWKIGEGIVCPDCLPA